jgi:hypothetical protein
MSNFSVRTASSLDLERWDDFVQRSCNGTLFHLLRFLQYHGDKFSNVERHVVIRKGDAIFALLSLAYDSQTGVARSPYGGSYGGFVFHHSPTYSDAAKLADAFLDYLRIEGIKNFTVTMPIACCCESSLDTFMFALIQRGFRTVQKAVSNVVSLKNDATIEQTITSRARNMVRKAINLGVRVETNTKLDLFWPVMQATFARHGKAPTHSYDDLAKLKELFPDRIVFDVGFYEEKPAAGVCSFVLNSRVVDSFYLCQNEVGRQTQALSLLIRNALELYKSKGFMHFDFGTSGYLNLVRPDLFRFKESFGSVGIFIDTLAYGL